MQISKDFKVGDPVFLKVKGHPHWPAAFSSIDSKNKLAKYNATFYGTGEVAFVKKIDIYFSFWKTKQDLGFLN